MCDFNGTVALLAWDVVLNITNRMLISFLSFVPPMFSIFLSCDHIR